MCNHDAATLIIIKKIIKSVWPQVWKHSNRKKTGVLRPAPNSEQNYWHTSLKKKQPSSLQFMRLPLSSSVIWGLVLPWVPLVVGERGLLVACGGSAAAVRVRSGVVVGRVRVLLVKFTHSLAIPSICHEGQKRLLEEAKTNGRSFSLQRQSNRLSVFDGRILILVINATEIKGSPR